MKIGDFSPIRIFKPGSSQGPSGADKVPGQSQKISLSVGQLLKAEITGFTEDGKMLIDIQGQTVTAKSQLPLKLGSELWLEVKQTDPELWLVVSDKKGAVSEFLRQAFADNSSVGRAVQALQSFVGGAKADFSPEMYAEFEALLQSFGDISLGGDADPEKLIKLFSWLNAGQTSSRKPLFPARLGEQLNDLLVALKRPGVDTTLDKTILSGIERLTGTIESMQAVNSHPAPINQLPFFLIPCLFAAGAGWGQCLLSADTDAGGEEGRRQASPTTLSFFLKMSHLGDLHLQVTIKDKALRGDLIVAEGGVRSHLEGCLPELREIIEGLGYGPVHFGCRVSKDNLMGLLKEELEKKAQLRPVNILDVTA